MIEIAPDRQQAFEAMPDHDEAVEEVLRHFKNTWEPRMRQALLAHIDQHGDEGLKPIIKEAMARLRSTL